MKAALRLLGACLALIALPSPAAAKVPDPVGPALWVVEDEDTRIYLFGTSAALPKGLEWFDSELEDALAASDELVTEIKLPPDPLEGAQTVRLMELPPGQSLDAILSDEERELWHAFLARQGFRSESFDRLTPWMASLIVTDISTRNTGIDARYAAEAVLSERATALGLKIGALETQAGQLGIFAALPLADQRALLANALQRQGELAPAMERIVDDWLAGDVDAIAAAMDKELPTPAIRDAILTDRNRAWADWIRQRLDQPGTVFLAVTAGHLGGEDSVQALLLAQGVGNRRLR